MERPLPTTPEVPRVGLGRDITRLKSESSASAGELREFLAQLRGKPIDQVLGIVSQSGLVRGTGVALVGTLVILVVFTIIPFTLNRMYPPPVKEKPSETAAATPTEESTKESETETAEKKDPRDAVLEKMGETETRVSDPESNPLEESGDDLLKEIK